MAISGDLSAFPLPLILEIFERRSKTGQLSIWSPTGIHQISFHQGRVVTAIAPEQNYTLKQILMASTQLSEAGLNYLQQHTMLHEPIGSIMKRQGLIISSTLALAFRQQIQVGILRLFHQRKGQFHFTIDAPLPYAEMTGMSQGSIEVAMLGLRKTEENDQNNDDFPRLDSIFIRTKKELPLLNLSSLEWGIWENVEPDQTLADLSHTLKADLLEVRKACYRLAQIGLLTKVIGRSRPTKTSPTVSSIRTNPTTARQEIPVLSSADSQEMIDKKIHKTQEEAVNSNLLNRFASLLRSVR